MFKPYELYIGLRYTRAKRRNHFISFISLISILGIALGVTALITVLSVMNGFENELRNRILGMASHATITSFAGPYQNWQSVQQIAQQQPRVIGSAPYVRAEAMLTQGKRVSGALIRGIEPAQEPAVSDIQDHLRSGELNQLVAGEYNIILGNELAFSLGATVGDKITLISPQATFTAAGTLPRMRSFTISGIFEVGMYEYDRGVALIHIEDAKKLFRTEGGVTGVRLKLDDLFKVHETIIAMQPELPQSLRISDWRQQHANFFQAIQTEKRVMFIILTLIVAVAAFNIVSTLVMVVTDKQADIAILRTLGATPRSIMGVFMVQGSIIGLFGVLLGAVGGVALAVNVETIVPAIEQAFNTQFLPADVYYISKLPSELHWPDVYRITGIAFVLCLLATLYPAWRASRVQPAEALRYE